jgi:integrase
MPRPKRELTAMPTSNRWRKKYKGEVYYFAGCKGLNDKAGYEAALAKWKAKKAELDVQAAVEAYREQAEAITPAGGWRTVFPVPEALLPSATSNPKQPTLGARVAEYIAKEQSRCELGDISAGRFDCCRRFLEYFRDFVGTDAAVEDTNARTLVDFHASLLVKLRKKEWSPEYCKGCMGDVKRFVHWLYESEYLEREPRNLHSADLKIKVAPKPIRVFTAAEAAAILQAAPESFRLYLLLMCNCGMTQKDISDLEQREVDWEKGLLSRKRSKTHKIESTPLVTYRLWGETLRLLKIYRSSDPQYVLTNEAGGRLKKEELDEAGKLKKSDPLAARFYRLLRDNSQLAQGSLKVFRKTSSTIMATHPVYGRFAQFFLAQSPRTVADKHYIQPPQDLFNDACQWLGQQYGF